jgi:hypothetical protein
LIYLTCHYLTRVFSAIQALPVLSVPVTKGPLVSYSLGTGPSQVDGTKIFWEFVSVWVSILYVAAFGYYFCVQALKSPG